MVALRAALTHLRDHPAHDQDPVVLCTDSQAALAKRSPREAGARRDRRQRSGRRSDACWPGSPRPAARSCCSGCLPTADCRGTSGRTPWPGRRPPSPKKSPSTRGPLALNRPVAAGVVPISTDPSWLTGCRPRCDAWSERPPSTSTRSGRATALVRVHSPHNLHRIRRSPRPDCDQCAEPQCRTCGEEPDSPEHVLRRSSALMTNGSVCSEPSCRSTRTSGGTTRWRPWWRPPGPYRADRLRSTEWVRREPQPQQQKQHKQQ